MLIVFDMDGIFIEERSSWKIIHKKFGIDNSDLVQRYIEGEMEDKEFLDRDIKRWRERGIKREDIVRIFHEIPLTDGTEKCLQFFKERVHTAIISGGIDLLANRIASFGIEHVFANGIEFREEMPWRGILRVPIKRKDIILRDLIKKLNLERKDVIVVGDTKYDLGMFKIAGNSIAFNAKEDIIKHADFVVKKRDLREIIKIWKNNFEV